MSELKKAVNLFANDLKKICKVIIRMFDVKVSEEQLDYAKNWLKNIILGNEDMQMETSANS